MQKLVHADIWRDGGSLSAVIETASGDLKAYWLQSEWPSDLQHCTHTNLYISDGEDPLRKTNRLEMESPAEGSVLNTLKITDIAHSTAEHRKHFASLIQVIEERHRPKNFWNKAPLSADLMSLKRFSGHEFYPIAKAEWNLYQHPENGTSVLWIKLAADFAVSQQEDTLPLNGQPIWEINLIENNLIKTDLIPGFRREIPAGYVESKDAIRLTNFYYCSHEDSNDNVIEITAADGDNLKIRLNGTTTDVNFYDDSKSDTSLTVETWFCHNPSGRKSFS